jgi:hypothetical protein
MLEKRIMRVESRFEGLSDRELLARLADLVSRSRRVEAELVAHLAEVDARRLYLGEACSSMHAYATERLHLSDAEAYLRITVARLSRRVPLVLAMLADGRLHLGRESCFAGDRLAGRAGSPDWARLTTCRAFRS